MANRNWKKTPIVITNRDRYTTTKKLIEQLLNLGYHNIHLLDNDSSYPDLMYYMAFLDLHKIVKVVRIANHAGSAKKNPGPYALFDIHYLNDLGNPKWVIMTDSDIELSPTMPENFVEQMVNFSDKYGIEKVSLALKLSDIEPHMYGASRVKHESQFWEKELEPNVYQAMTDTTFSLLKNPHFQYDSIRLAGPDWECRHIPWYLDFMNLPEEEIYYMRNTTHFSTMRAHFLEWCQQNNVPNPL